MASADSVSPPQVVSVARVFGGQVPIGAEVIVRGWVRTRRDSKAGLSFIHVHDGSCFEPLQVVAPGDLPNYHDGDRQARRRLRGRGHGHAGREPGQGAGGRAQRATPSRSSAGSTIPRPIPIQQKRHTIEYLREVAHLRPRTNTLGALTRVRHCLSAGDPPLLPRRGLLLDPHADHHGQRRRGRGRDVPGEHARSREPAAHRRGQDRLLARLLRARGLPDRERAAQRRGVLPGDVQGLHVRPDVPRREQQHQPPPGRVLDDRARDRLRRSRRRRRSRRAFPEVDLRGAARRARRRHEVLRRARRQGLHRARRALRRAPASRA